jgi:hypothetical protein
MIESGMDPDEKHFNMFFTKADASIASAREEVVRPAHVKLLDYEVEACTDFPQTDLPGNNGNAGRPGGLCVWNRNGQ